MRLFDALHLLRARGASNPTSIRMTKRATVDFSVTPVWFSPSPSTSIRQLHIPCNRFADGGRVASDTTIISTQEMIVIGTTGIRPNHVTRRASARCRSRRTQPTAQPRARPTSCSASRKAPPRAAARAPRSRRTRTTARSKILGRPSAMKHARSVRSTTNSRPV